MSRTHGWGHRSQRVTGELPSATAHTLSVVGAMALDGFRALAAYDGAIHAEQMVEFINLVLAPGLYPGDIVVLDNASIHRCKLTREAFKNQGISTLFLPPYHPDLNPIEKAWSKLKALLRKAAVRTLDALLLQLNLARRQFQSNDFYSWFVHAGYADQPI